MSESISSSAATSVPFEFTGACKLLHQAKYEDGDNIVGCRWGDSRTSTYIQSS